MHRGFVYKLHPSRDQEDKLLEFISQCRLVYNLALEQRRDHWRRFQINTGNQLNFASQSRELTQLRYQVEWLKAAPQVCQQQALRDLDAAYKNFFAGRANYPKFRKKGVDDSFRFPGRYVRVRKLNKNWSTVTVPKIGEIRFRDTRELDGRAVNATISLIKGEWRLSICCEVQRNLEQSPRADVGIDRGITNTIYLSTGESMSLPAKLLDLERKNRRKQRQWSKKKDGSRRKLKAQAEAAKYLSKAARIRRDWHHKTTRILAKNFDLIVIEELDVSRMAKSAKGKSSNPGKNVKAKSNLNRLIMNQAWFTFESLLSYKVEEHGGSLSKVNPAYTSQTCSKCKTVSKKSRKSQATFKCVNCGFCINADHNAAINILRRNTASMDVEEGHKSSSEALT